MTTKTVARDLLAAADYINEHGWCRNDFLNQKGQVCLAGAVGVVTGAIKLVDGEDFWEWSRAKATRARYGNAVAALARQLNAERAEELLAEYDRITADEQQNGWFRQASPERQRDYLTRRALSRCFVAQDLVTTFNDKEVRVERPGAKTTIKRTTKAQAVKLLQRAAAA